MTKNLLASGHTACAGCGEALAARLVINAAGSNVIIANPTGCLEIFTSRFPQSAWEVPWIHSLFENGPAVGTGIRAALKALGRDDEAKVIVQGGDGGIGDIGFGALSGMFERNDDALCICYDNEAYMNTGIQRSGLTPFDARDNDYSIRQSLLGKSETKERSATNRGGSSHSLCCYGYCRLPKGFRKKG